MFKAKDSKLLQLQCEIDGLNDKLERLAESHEARIEAKDEVIKAWLDRGDRYAAANTELLNQMASLNKVLSGVITGPDTLAAYKEMITKLTASTRESK